MPPPPSPMVAWPVRPQRLAQLLGDTFGAASVRIVWATWMKQPGVLPLRTTWTPDTTGFIGSGFGEFGATIFIEPVQRAQHRVICAQLEAEAIPALVGWLHDALRSHPAWQLSHHERAWFYVDGRVSVQDRDGFHQEAPSYKPRA